MAKTTSPLPEEMYPIESISGLMQAYTRRGYDHVVGRHVRLEEGILWEYKIELPTDYMPRQPSCTDKQRLLQIEQAYDQFCSTFTLHAAGIGGGSIAFTFQATGNHAKWLCEKIRSLEIFTFLALSQTETQKIHYIPIIVEGTIQVPPPHLLDRIYLNAEKVSFGTMDVFP